MPCTAVEGGCFLVGHTLPHHSWCLWRPMLWLPCLCCCNAPGGGTWILGQGLVVVIAVDWFVLIVVVGPVNWGRSW